MLVLKRKAIFTGAVRGSGNEDGDPPAADPTPPPAADPTPPPAAAAADPVTPSDNEAKLLKEVMTRKARAKEQEVEILTLKEQLSKFDGVDLEEIKALIDTKKNAETKALEEKGQWEALKTQMRDENAKLVKETVDKYAALQDVAAKQQAIIDKLTLGNSFNTSAFILNDLNLSPEKAKIIYGSHFEVEDDKTVAYDKPKGAKDRVQLINADGDSLSFEDAIKKIIDADPDKATLIKQKAKPGAGSGSLGATPKPAPQQVVGISRIEAALNSASK